MMSNTRSSYDRDFYAWAFEQAELLRAGRLTEADIGNIAEEIESMGRSEKRELINRLAVLLTHLLKWQVQPSYRSKSWRLTVVEQRRQLERHLKDNPSLKSSLNDAIFDAFGDALVSAQQQTGLDADAFPATCAYTPAQIFDGDFLPD